MKFSYAYIAAQFLSPVSAFTVPVCITAEAVGRADGILTLLIITSETGVRNATVAPALRISCIGSGE